MDPGEIVALVISLLALAASGAGVLLSERANRISQQSKDIAQRTFDADNFPQISVEVAVPADFPGWMTLPAGPSYRLDHPPPFVAPIPIFLATVKNEGKIPVTITKAGIRLERTGVFIEFRGDDVSESQRFRPLPLDLAARQSFKIPATLDAIRRMLGVVQAQPADEFTVQVIESIDRPYRSLPEKAAAYLGERAPLEVTVHFDSPITMELGEEEYFPEGLFPPTPPKDRPPE